MVLVDHPGRARQRTADTADDRTRQIAEALAHQVVGRQILGDRQGCFGTRFGVTLEVVELAEHLDDPDTVGDRMAHVQQLHRATAFESLDQHHAPQRPRDVQRRLKDHVGHVEDLAQGTGLGKPHPAHVVIEVEVGIDDPPRRGGRQRRHDDLLAQPG